MSKLSLRQSYRAAGRSASRVAENMPAIIGGLALFAGESLSYGQVHLRFQPNRDRLSSLGLDARDLAIVTTVADCRLITSKQVERLHFANYPSPQSGARARQRTLKRLVAQQVLSSRTRRIGGIRRGSASFVYSLGTIGAKLLSDDGKRLSIYTTDPSDYFFDHTLEQTELYTRLHELAHAGKLQLIEIQTEPDCWRPMTNGRLCPDMFVRTAIEDDEYSFFIEVDRGTTHLPSIIRKLQQYEQYYASGIEQRKHGVFPQVVWIVPDRRRARALEMAVSASQRRPAGLFVVKTLNPALAYISGQSAAAQNR